MLKCHPHPLHPQPLHPHSLHPHPFHLHLSHPHPSHPNLLHPHPLHPHPLHSHPLHPHPLHPHPLQWGSRCNVDRDATRIKCNGDQNATRIKMHFLSLSQFFNFPQFSMKWKTMKMKVSSHQLMQDSHSLLWSSIDYFHPCCFMPDENLRGLKVRVAINIVNNLLLWSDDICVGFSFKSIHIRPLHLFAVYKALLLFVLYCFFYWFHSNFFAVIMRCPVTSWISFLYLIIRV